MTAWTAERRRRARHGRCSAATSPLDRGALRDHASRRPFANPLARRRSTTRSRAAADGARASLDVGCGAGELLARLAARHRRCGRRASSRRPSGPRRRGRGVDVVHEAPFAEVTLEHGGYDLVCCLALLARDRVLGRVALRGPWPRWRGADGGLGLVGEGFWRREPSAGYLERARRRERRRAAARVWRAWRRAHATRAGRCSRRAVASDADWARYEETLLANGEAELRSAAGSRPARLGRRGAGALGGRGRAGHDGLRAADAAAGGCSRASRSAHHPRRRAPDQVVAHLVGVGAERHPAADEPPRRRARRAPPRAGTRARRRPRRRRAPTRSPARSARRTDRRRSW